jgi:hypothetical protein
MGLDYGVLVEKAFRAMIRSALRKAQNMAEENLCFMIVINTRHRGVVIPKYLKTQYPDSITLIMQHQFANLRVQSNYFSAELNFGGKFESISIPFGAIQMFTDRTSGMELVLDMMQPNIDNGGYSCVYSFELGGGGFMDSEEEEDPEDNVIQFEDIRNFGEGQ